MTEYTDQCALGGERVIRVFPRRTKATPDDELAYVGYPTLFADADRVLISVAFTYDIPEAERLAAAWQDVAPVEMGGPAFGQPGGEFVPGKFLKHGYVITSRGCPNHCWFCSVWKREKGIKELPITDGWNVLDDNLLACSEEHIRAVFAMLKRQKEKAQFTGGIEAKLLKPWHVDLFHDLKPAQIFFAYDTKDDYDPLVVASEKMRKAGFTRHQMRCYVLIGYPNDTIDKADERMKQVMQLGIFPHAMTYRDKNGDRGHEWIRFAKLWSRPALIYARNKQATA